jgi:hypothetical protein
MAGRISYYGNIVRDGLVLNLDAAKRDSYPGSGTTWRDIAGGVITGSLVNGPTFDSANAGSIVFDGTNDYSILTTNIFRTTLPNFTISVWYKKTIDGILLGNHYHNNSWESIWFSTTVFIVNGAPNSSTNRQSLSYTSTTSSSTIWYNMVAVNNSSLNYMKVFLNGTEHATKSATVVPWDSNIPPTLGAQRVASPVGVQGALSGNISNLLIYNKALSETEILQNYNATKGRYL